MADGASLVFDLAAIDKAGDRIARQYLSAGTRTIGAVTRRAEQRLEELTREAAGGKLWRAWQSSVYPKGGKPARDPAGEIWIKGGARTRGAMEYWTEAGTIRPKFEDQWLPIPLRAAGKRNQKGLISPTLWLQYHPDWNLRRMNRAGRNPLLVAVRRAGRRRDTSASDIRPRRSSRISEGEPVFVLVPINPFRNAVAVAPVIRRAEGEMPSEYRRQAGTSS